MKILSPLLLLVAGCASFSRAYTDADVTRTFRDVLAIDARLALALNADHTFVSFLSGPFVEEKSEREAGSKGRWAREGGRIHLSPEKGSPQTLEILRKGEAIQLKVIVGPGKGIVYE